MTFNIHVLYWKQNVMYYGKLKVTKTMLSTGNNMAYYQYLLSPK